jgi:hypothetical protein
MRSRPVLSAHVVFLVLALCILQTGWAAVSGPDSSTVPPAQLAFAYPLMAGEALVSPWQMPGKTAAIKDFDGDNKADVAIGRMIGNRYGIVIHLSSRPGLTVLRSPAALAGFTLLACDINQDSFADLVVTSPTAPHPLAVWLGDGRGGFTAADQTRFDNCYGLTTSPSCDSQNFPFQQNFLTEPPRPACDKPRFAFAVSGPEPNGFITYKAILRPLQDNHFLLSPRSPPIFLRSGKTTI